MKITCGTDIIEIDRIKEDIEHIGKAFIDRIFTEKEIQYCESKKSQKYQHYAARFAAKEAVFKAISHQLEDKFSITWKDIEITNDKNGRPNIEIFGINKESIESMDISLSHCKEYAIANVTMIYKDDLKKPKIKFFDSHAHLDDEKFNDDREEIIESIHKEIDRFVSAGYSLEGSKAAVDLAKKYDFIYCTCGISPNDIPQNEEELWTMLDKIKELVKTSSKNVAIGEIGLDYYWNKENKDLQKKAFIEQIKLANELNLPIVIHTREAVMDTIEILKKHEVKNKGVFHCCPLNRELVKEALKLGFYISFAGPITFKNSKNADEIINLVPNDKILIETDSPYLSPEPLRGKRNDPRNVKYTAQKIADVKQITLEEVADFTYNNACKIFGLKK